MISRISIAILLAAEAEAGFQKKWLGGEVQTLDSFTYGRFSTRMKGPGKKGTVSAFFTFNYPENFGLDWEGGNNWNEIDFEIVPSSQEGVVSLNIFSGMNTPFHEDQAYAEPKIDPGEAWAEYVIEWKPHSIEWFVDGKTVRRVESSPEHPSVAFQNKPQAITLNFWSVEPKEHVHDWAENFDDSDMPWFTRYDWVQVEKYEEYSGGWSPIWRDEFDSFDESRWKKMGSLQMHKERSSDMDANNVIIKHGSLLLKMDCDPAVHDANTLSPSESEFWLQ